ncbi:MAG: hypothetical protein AAF354_15385 [Pseudomonadota bacterium]
MNIATFPKAPEDEPRDYKPWDAPELAVDWERFGKCVQAFRAKTGADRTLMAEACGVQRGQIELAERFRPLCITPFIRICTFLQRDPTFFYKTLAGWQPHLPPSSDEKPIRLCIGDRYSLQVADFAEASSRYLELQGANGEGCSTWPLGRLYAGTQEIGRISYNGRVWAPIEWSDGDRPIYDPRLNG